MGPVGGPRPNRGQTVGEFSRPSDRGRPTLTGIEPELWVERAGEAVAFYEQGFGATTLHWVGVGNDIVAQVAAGPAFSW